MSTVTNVGSSILQAYPLLVSSQKGQASTANARSDDATPLDQGDIVDLSPTTQRVALETGRIALKAEAGKLTSEQTTELYQQLSSIQAQIAADEQTDGGTLSPRDAKAIDQMQTQLSSTIYSDAHDGAAPPSTPPAASEAVKREAMEAGRIQLNEQGGTIPPEQAQQLMAQQAQIDQKIAADEKANGGSLTPAEARSINQLQNQASKQIHEAAHPSGS